LKFILHIINEENTILLIASIVIGKGLVILFTPLITKLYEPSAFGILALILSYGNVLGVFMSMRYELKFLNIDKNKRNDLKFFLSTHIVISFILSLFVVIVLVYVFSFPSYILIIPFLAFLNALYEINRMQNVTNKEFKAIALSETLRGANQGIVPLIGFLSKSFAQIGLIISEILARIFSIIALKKSPKKILSLYSLSSYMQYLRLSYKEMLLTGPTKIINVSTNEFIIIGIGFFFSKELLGLYFFARKVVGVPLSFVTKAMGDVINPSISEKFINSGEKEAKNYTIQQLSKLFLYSLVFVVVTLFLVDYVVDIFLDEQYAAVSKIIKYSIIYYFALLIVKPISNYFNIVGRYNFNFIWDITRFLLVLLSFVLAYIFDLDFYIFILILSTALFISYLIFVLVLVLKEYSK
jgi:O-antigen/teichoic acid export membrane protein